MSNKANRFRRSKYGAKKTYCAAGHKHDSKREAHRCDELVEMQANGLIVDLVNQPQFWFVIDGKQLKHRNGRRVGYQADFSYVVDGRKIIEDAKGFAARDWPLRRALFEALFSEYELREV